jgi:MFS transporter, UMF1 family
MRLLPLLSWAFYDFANTIFSAIVLTAYFPLYFTKLSGNNSLLAVGTTSAMILAGIAVPFLGSLSDQTGKTKQYLIRTTLAAIGFLALFPYFKNPNALIFCLMGACFFFHASIVFYNSLLPVVAEKKKQGFASGLGTGLGYLGVVFALPLAHAIDKKFGTPSVFTMGAVLFLIFSLPLFFFVPERAVDQNVFPSPYPSPRLRGEGKGEGWRLWQSQWKKILTLIKELPRKPALLFFFIGNFFAVDSLNSMILWFSVYTREVYHPSQATLISLLIAVNVSAFAAGILTGILTDKVGAMKTFLFSTGILALSFLALPLMQRFEMFVLVSLLGGATAIAGIWTASRKALIELSPQEKIGEYFGLYGLTTKISVIGNLLFAVIADHFGFRAALWALVIPASVGWICLYTSGKMQKW